MQIFVRHRFHSPAIQKIKQTKKNRKKYILKKKERKSGKGDQGTGNVEIILVILLSIIGTH